MEIYSGSRYVTTLDDPPDRDERGRFTRGNRIAYQGFQAILNRHFDSDRVAFRAWFSQLGLYVYGLNYRRRGPDFDYYPVWVKPCFRIHPGKPCDFMRQRRQQSADVNFYASEVQHGT